MTDNLMKSCSTCGAESPAFARFCSQCGSFLQNAQAVVCSQCGAGIVPNSCFCLYCGEAVVTGTAPVEKTTRRNTGASVFHRLGPTEYVRHLLNGAERLLSERRTVTTLFADIVDSTSLAEKLDPEDVTAIMNKAFQVLTEPVRRYEGTLARLMGDGVLCLFGAPVAHEDDAARACRSALEIVVGVERLSDQLRDTYGLDSFEVRIGISTGLAVVGEVGTENRAEYTAMGNSVNLASRLQGTAKPNSILICQETRQQVNRIFDTEDMGLFEIKGKAAPVPAYRLVGLTTHLIEEQSRAPFVGRTAELQQMKELLHGLRENRGALLCLAGGAGIGKSRLLWEARQSAPKEISWAEIRCHSYTREMSYWAARGMLQNCLGIKPFTPQDLSAQLLSDSLNRIIANAQLTQSTSKQDAHRVPDPSVFASLTYLLHLPLSDEEQAVIRSRKGEALQHDILFAYRQHVRVSASARPLVMVWEDAHWIDPPSLRILKALVPLCGEVPLFIVLTARPEIGPVRELREELRNDPHQPFVEIELSPLSPQISSRLLRHLLANAKIPEDVFAQLLSTAGGNPFFLEEMFRDLTDAGFDGLRRNADLPAQTLKEFAVPSSVQAVIMSRIDRLAFQQKKTLQVASAASGAFMRDVLYHVLEPDISGEELDDALQTLEERGLIQRVSIHDESLSSDSSMEAATADAGQTAQPPASADEIGEQQEAGDKQFIFTHTMIAEVVYQSLLRAERKRLHQLVGETIETLFTERIDEFVQTLAYHFERGGDVGRAVKYLFFAGAQSAEFFALDTAREYYTRALRLAASDKEDAIDPVFLRRLPEAFGDIHYFSSEYEEALHQYDNALHKEKGRKHQATLLRKKGKVLEKWGRYDLAREAFELALKVMEAAFDEREAGQIYTGLCLVHLHNGDLSTAAELGGVALKMNQSAQDELAIAEASNNLGVILAKKEDWKNARRHYLQAQKIYERMGNRYGLATCYNNRGVLASNQGEYERALRWFRKSVRIFETLGNQHGMARAYDNMSQAFYRKGDSMRSEKYVERAVKILSELSGDRAAPSAELWQSGIW